MEKHSSTSYHARQSKKIPLAYYADQYTAPTQKQVEENVERAKRIGAKLIEKGYAVYLPVVQTHDLAQTYLQDFEYDEWLKRDLAILRRCDLLVMGPKWTESYGAKIERKYALIHRIPVYFYSTLIEEEA